MTKPEKTITLRNTEFSELPQIFEMEQGDARPFIIPYSLVRHQNEFVKDDIIYRSVWKDSERIGFVILALDPDGRSLEFRRIVITKPGFGFGKHVVREIDRVCRDELKRKRIWLDVFETNERARHVYEKCGYKQFGTSVNEGMKLLLYEKRISDETRI